MRAAFNFSTSTRVAQGSRRKKKTIITAAPNIAYLDKTVAQQMFKQMFSVLCLPVDFSPASKNPLQKGFAKNFSRYLAFVCSEQDIDRQKSWNCHAFIAEHDNRTTNHTDKFSACAELLQQWVEELPKEIKTKFASEIDVIGDDIGCPLSNITRFWVKGRRVVVNNADEYVENKKQRPIYVDWATLLDSVNV